MAVAAKGLLYEDYLQGTEQVLKASQNKKEKYSTKVLGKEFVVHPGVFSAKYFFDTEFFAKSIAFRRGEEFLEIGPGTGVVNVFAALEGAGRVVAIDINPKAVANTQENVNLHGVAGQVTVREGDVYEGLADHEKFDTIFWNTPFGYIEKGKPVSDLERAVFDPGYEATARFIKGAKNHLKPGGRLLIGFSQTLGKWAKIEEILKKEGYRVKLMAQTKSLETHPVTFDLFKATMLTSSHIWSKLPTWYR